MKVKQPPIGVSPEVAQWMRETQAQVNGMAEGQAEAFYSKRTAAPTTGTWGVGDFVKNSAVTELGSGGSKYMIIGWTCTVAGTPGTWLENRTLTGN